MGFFSDMFSGAANGAIHSVARGARGAAPAIRQFERLCGEVGWSIDERLGNTGIVLHFKDPVFGVRPVLITTSDSSDLTVLTCYSAAKFAANELPPALTYHLLGQNKDAFFHSWQLAPGENSMFGLAVRYTTFASALQPSIFKTICESMAQALSDLDAKLRNAGLL